MSLDNCKLIDNSNFIDARGSLIVAQLGDQFHFPIKRQYIIQNCLLGYERGFHAHKNLWQYFICLSGSVEFHLFDGSKNKKYKLDDPNVGLIVGPMVWRELKNFDKDTILSVLASDTYDESDYILDRSILEEIASK